MGNSNNMRYNKNFISHIFKFSPISQLTNSELVLEGIHTMLNDLIPFLFGIKWTSVFYCKWDINSNKETSCVIATDESFGGANGLTVNKERTKLFVNDAPLKKITVFSINQETKILTKDTTIDLPMCVDNIEYDYETEEIIMGTIPDLLAAVKIESDATVSVPGGMAVLRKVGKDWSIEDVLEHDGTKLCQVSTAARYGSKFVLGSPFAEGILVCNTD